MKKSCGAWLAAYLVLAAVTGAIAYRRAGDAGVAAGAGFAGGGIAWMALGYFAGIGTKLKNRRMIERGLGADRPQDGEKIAAIGRITASGTGPLTSPLSKTSCVAYKYEIRSGMGISDHDTTYYEGFALTPSVIQGRQRSIRLLAWADLNVPWETVPASAARANAEAYIAETEFQQPAILNFRKAIGEIKAIYKDDDGSVRWDMRGLRPPLDVNKPIDFQSATYRERVLRDGDSVCVTGHYSEQRGGIVPSDHPMLDPVSIETGAEEVFARRASGGAAGYFIGGLIFGAIYIAGLAAMLAFFTLEAAEQRNPSMVASWPEIRVEHFLDRRMRPLMYQAGMLTKSTLVIALRPGTANGRVKLGSRDEVVRRAVLRTDDSQRTIIIDDGVVALTIDPRGLPLRLVILGRQVPDLAASVQISENGQDEVAGRITFISGDANMPACRVTFRAERGGRG